MQFRNVARLGSAMLLLAACNGSRVGVSAAVDAGDMGADGSDGGPFGLEDGGDGSDGGPIGFGDGGDDSDGGPIGSGDGGHGSDGGLACTGPCCCADSSATCSCELRMRQSVIPACVASTCNALMTCPTGFSCQHDSCVCTDPALCGAICGSDGACPCGLVCSGANRCIPCAFSSNCAEGEVCRNGTCLSPPPPGSSPNGSACGEASECSGSACTFRTCTKHCSTNADCPSGLICAESDNLQGNGCVLPAATTCPSGCHGSTETCSLYKTPAGYCATWCEKESDCPSGRCMASTDLSAHPAASFIFYRVCLPSTAACNPDEYEIEDNEHHLYCGRDLGCTRTADCPSTYETCLFGPLAGSARGACAHLLSADGGRDAGPACGFDSSCNAGNNAQCAVSCAAGAICALSSDCATPHYAESISGTVTDEVTGLLWQKDISANPCGSGTGCTWAQAQAYCTALNLGGYASGWAVPTVEQLFSLVTAGVTPAMDSNHFAATANEQVWSASSVQGAGIAWFVDFENGNVGPASTGVLKAVRCVH